MHIFAPARSSQPQSSTPRAARNLGAVARASGTFELGLLTACALFMTAMWISSWFEPDVGVDALADWYQTYSARLREFGAAYLQLVRML